MYSRHEAAHIRKEFWTKLGLYLAPINGADGWKLNWLNYKTGYRNLYFRMGANRASANIAIQMAHKDPDLRQLYYEQFLELKHFLHDTVGEEWQWVLNAEDDLGHPISRIGTSIENVNIFDEQCWPEMIGFLKPRMIALDEFWSLVNHHFLPLKSLGG